MSKLPPPPHGWCGQCGSGLPSALRCPTAPDGRHARSTVLDVLDAEIGTGETALADWEAARDRLAAAFAAIDSLDA